MNQPSISQNLKQEFKIKFLNNQINVVKITPEKIMNGDVAIVFLHDSIGSVEQWKSFPEKIAKKSGIESYFYDRLGHGKSDSMLMPREKNYLQIEAYIYLRGLIESLNLNKVILIGIT